MPHKRHRLHIFIIPSKHLELVGIARYHRALKASSAAPEKASSCGQSTKHAAVRHPRTAAAQPRPAALPAAGPARRCTPDEASSCGLRAAADAALLAAGPALRCSWQLRL